MNELILGGIVLIAAYLLFMTILVTVFGDTSIGNFTWGGGVTLLALYTFFKASSYQPRQILLTLLTVLWALRLIIYVAQRYTGKDPRFLTWKRKGLGAFFFNLLFMFIGQLAFMLVMAWPVVLVNTSNVPGFTFKDVLATILWASGFIIEALADYQLFFFTRKPENKGKVMRYGLWKYSRHPNYFGEAVMWWAIFLIALSAPYGFTTIITPLTITFLLRFVTGVPLVERAMADNPEYQEYQRRTSVFIPWFVKK